MPDDSDSPHRDRGVTETSGAREPHEQLAERSSTSSGNTLSNGSRSTELLIALAR